MSRNTVDLPAPPFDGVAQLAQARAAALGLAQLVLTKDGALRLSIDKRSGFPTTHKFEKERVMALIAGLAACTNLAASTLPAGDSLSIQFDSPNGAVHGPPGDQGELDENLLSAAHRVFQEIEYIPHLHFREGRRRQPVEYYFVRVKDRVPRYKSARHELNVPQFDRAFYGRPVAAAKLGHGLSFGELQYPVIMTKFVRDLERGRDQEDDATVDNGDEQEGFFGGVYDSRYAHTIYPQNKFRDV